MAQQLGLSVRDMTCGDLAACTWAGPPEHLAQMRAAIERSATGLVDYLAILDDSGAIVGSCGIDYLPYPDTGYLWQLTVHPDMRSRGIGTILIAAAERRIVARGLHLARLDVELRNVGAHRLYYRLGYNDEVRREVSWYERRPGGVLVLHVQPCMGMVKSLMTRR